MTTFETGSGSDAVPQPWETAKLSERQFFALAGRQEAHGHRLVVQVLHGAYQDPNWGHWLVDDLEWLDWRTGESIERHPADEEPEFEGHDRLFVVERRLA